MSLKSFHHKLKDKGQSTIEFLIGFTVVFGLTFLMLRTTLMFGNGYLLHYATYMASRAYLVFETNDNASGIDSVFSASATRATQVFQTFGLSGVTVNFNDNNNVTRPVLIGAWAEIEKSFTSAGFMGGDNSIKFRSESFLLKEPPRGYCHERTLKQIERTSEISSEIHDYMTVFDNGC